MESRRKFSLLVSEGHEQIPDSKSTVYSERTEPYTNILQFKKNISKKYLLTIESKLNLGGFVAESKVEIRWLLALKSTEQNEYTFELITLDHAMLKNSDSGYLEIHKLVVQMHKALNEIVFTLDDTGNLKRILNIETIRSRWQSVKNELMEYNKSTTSLQELFKINDELFEKEGGIHSMVKSMEFFDICINQLYGKRFPFDQKKDIPNLYRTAQLPFHILFKTEKQKESPFFLIYMNGRISKLPESFLEKAYGSFPFFKIQDIDPAYEYNATYKVDSNTGFIEDAQINYIEDVHEKLGGEIHYNLKSYE